jgi:hypothetical protein
MNGATGWLIGFRQSRAGRKDLRNWRPGEVFAGIVVYGPRCMVTAIASYTGEQIISIILNS